MDKAKPFCIPKREVWEAYKQVKANQGAAGVDGGQRAEDGGRGRATRAERVGFVPTDDLAAVTSLAGMRDQPDSATAPFEARSVEPLHLRPSRRGGRVAEGTRLLSE